MASTNLLKMVSVLLVLALYCWITSATELEDRSCSGGLVWSNCTKNCTITCDDFEPACAEGCTPGCKCPDDKPHFHDCRCWTYNDCYTILHCTGGQVWSWEGGREGKECHATCDSPNIDCPAKSRIWGCRCPPERPLWNGNLCVRLSECPQSKQCTGGQVWKDCGSTCTATCSEPTPRCSTECASRCECPPEKPILRKGECVKYSQCPDEERCSGGMLWTTCGSACTKTCMEPNPRCTRQCVARCQCPPSRPILWNGLCIPFDHCPVAERCPSDRVWKDCGSACPKSCDDQEPTCSKKCAQGCFCPDDAPYLSNGTCVALDKCPVENQCKHGMIYSNCTSECTATCYRPFPRGCAQCVPGCTCPYNKPFLDNGECVGYQDCSRRHVCPENQEWVLFGAECVQTCEDRKPDCANREIQAGCQCKPDRPYIERNETGRCFTASECDAIVGLTTTAAPKCPDIQVWHQSASPCTRTCDDPFPTCTSENEARCACPNSAPIWHENQCIRVDQCPGKVKNECSGGQVWMSCGSKCTQTCGDPSTLCEGGCYSRCQCPLGRPVLHMGKCIGRDQCPTEQERMTTPAPGCTGGRTWQNCASPCTFTCETRYNLVCAAVCIKKCACPKHAPFWHEGKCVAESDCP
ncbi:SCO-spondin [Lingula anatina]|uniref:SCO-spondin n=1 Tax=Lingula anatina TaxID=7574 RepID=A0A1S3HUH6_LINAN|nr:SCO-spondin [Lingula anatina]XP_013389197.1 SCO-spondin [Lingula anatina]|eukprot:XP_013389196.1 SCO-spondin [Lingula anatina]